MSCAYYSGIAGALITIPVRSGAPLLYGQAPSSGSHSRSGLSGVRGSGVGCAGFGTRVGAPGVSGSVSGSIVGVDGSAGSFATVVVGLIVFSLYQSQIAKLLPRSENHYSIAHGA